MPLFKVKKQLYKKGEEEKREDYLSSEFYRPKQPVDVSQLKEDVSKEIWEEKKSRLSDKQIKALKIGGIVLSSVFVIAVLSASIYKFRISAFSEEKVSVNITGPKEISSGKIVSFEISFKNSNRASLENAILRINYPDNFRPEIKNGFVEESSTNGQFKIGKIGGGKEGKFVLSGKAYVPKGTLLYLRGELIYEPSSLNSQFVSKNQLGVEVFSSPITLDIQAPQNVSNNDELNYLITYQNDSGESFQGIKLKAEYPQGFKFAGSDPSPTESNNSWYLGTLEPGKQGKISVKGRLEGAKDEIKNFKVFIGSVDKGGFLAYNEENAQTKISGSPLFISQKVNNKTELNVNAADRLEFEIYFRNDGPVGLKNLIVTDILDSPVLDYSKLDAKGGSFDMDTRTITWKTAGIPKLQNLEPGQSGTIEFTIDAKSKIPVSSKNDKNFIITSIAKIDSPDVPTPIQMNKIVSSNNLDIKLNSKMILEVKSFFSGDTIANTGPMPPKVGAETTYTLHWRVTNVSNDLSNAKVRAFLPPGVTMTGKKSPDNANFSYNERNNEVVWEIGNLEAGTGILGDPKEVIFQIMIKPPPDQAEESVILLQKSEFSGKDAFTGEDLKVEIPEKSNAEMEKDNGLDYRVLKS